MLIASAVSNSPSFLCSSQHTQTQRIDLFIQELSGKDMVTGLSKIHFFFSFL